MRIECRRCGWTELGAYLPTRCPNCEHLLEDPGSEVEDAENGKYAECEPGLESEQMAVRESTVTISSLSEGYRSPTPFIRLRGKWLERLGWHSGSQVHVQAGTDAIVLLKEAPQTQIASTNKQRRMPCQKRTGKQRKCR